MDELSPGPERRGERQRREWSTWRPSLPARWPGRLALCAVALVGLAAAGLGAEVAYVLSRDFLGADDEPSLGGTYAGPGTSSLRLAVLGDSTAAGVGVDDPRDTVAVRLALLLSVERSVDLDVFGVSGARAADLDEQVDRALTEGPGPDVAVLLVGPNDATHLTRLSTVRTAVGSAVERLRAAGIEVVVGSCADLGAATAFPQPLRAMSAARGRAVGAATREAARAAGAFTVDIGAETGPAFRRDPGRYLSTDEFHPSADGYALWADALETAVRAATATATGEVTA